VRILILTQYYPPETGAPQNRLSDLAQRLYQAGHEVTVLTALPNYPRGEIFEDYRGCLLMEEAVSGVKIVRTWIYATPKKDFVRRLLNYFSFVFTSFALGFWKVGSPEVVIVESPPLFLGISAWLLAFFKNARLVFNVSDLWPDSAVAMGILSNKSLIRWSRRLEEFLYQRSFLITGQTQGIVDNIQSRFADKRVALITNGVDVKRFLLPSTGNQKNEIKREFGLADKFVIGYAGLHGLAQGLDTVVHAARLLRSNRDLVFAFFGDGPEKEKLVRLAHEFELRNLYFFPSQATARMPAIIGSFDLALVPLRRLELFKGALPSKMFEAMAAAVPMIVSVDGEARALVQRARAGVFVEAENPEAMAGAILELRQDRERLAAFGMNGRQYVLEHYDRQKIAENFERLLIENDWPEAATA
jgi:glycosyltransferase involved in cell wall biosynthesis